VIERLDKIDSKDDGHPTVNQVAESDRMPTQEVSGVAAKSIAPLRLLLYLEWLLLALAILSVVSPMPLDHSPPWSPLTLLSIAIFGLMGLRLPSKNLTHKILYTALEFLITVLLPILYVQVRFIPFLIMIIVIRGCQIFQLPGRLLVTSLSFGLFVLTVLLGSESLPLPLRIALAVAQSEGDIFVLRLNLVLSSGITFTVILLLVNSLLTERHNQQKLAIAHDQLRQYSSQIEAQATLKERNRIAREIHDALGHTLSAQSIQLENALLFCPPDAEKTKSFLTESRHLCIQALQEVRQSVAKLRSDYLKEHSLEKAIALTLNEFQHTIGIQPICDIEISHPLSFEMSIAIHKILQEALMNICKHSEATQVRIELRQNERSLVLKVSDNGKGFAPEQNTTGFGIQGMRERTMAVGGQLNLVSQPDGGCLITCYFPLMRVI
jgi:signal transduction histidine kinase